MIDHLRLLKNLTNRFYSLPDKDWELFSSIWKPFEAKRKVIITAEGEVEKFLYFVADGVQRVYYSDDLQREATLVFTYAPSFGGVLDSFLLQQPSKYFYETLTPSVFLRTSFIEVQKVAEESRAIQQLIQNGTNLSFSGLMERTTELQCFSSEEKFKNLLKRSPHILNLVPHKYLANYIGIDATNFSKLINSVKI
ncbi:MAG TPA: cyclic nucleotide-binding domain-containing protein [Cyclobacteriaceae bacterium]|jgi:CRP-like cAMP-binding protein|nr:cyclic nucleotide-binding domain-containing protein [Cyclobacteriaceae bacterium]